MQMDKKGANLRGALYVLIAIIAAVLEDHFLRESLPVWAISVLKLSGAGLGAWRIYIDTSHGDSQIVDEDPAPSLRGKVWPKVSPDDTQESA